MTAATLAEAGAYAIVHAGWTAADQAQLIPFPRENGGEFLRARSRLWHLTDAYARGHKPAAEADLGAIQKAAEALAAIVGGEEGRAA